MRAIVLARELIDRHGREIRVVEPVFEHRRTEEHAVDAVAQPPSISALARQEKLDASLGSTGLGSSCMKQTKAGPRRSRDQAGRVTCITAGQTAPEILSPAAVRVLLFLEPTARARHRRVAT